MIKQFLISIMILLLVSARLSADEGMWIPMLLEKYNIKDMQAKGLKLSAEDLYSINNTSIKDAIVIFGGGCTGELISDQGLLITNHHCGYSQIQSHSSVENDYLTNGFWAMSKKEELVCPGLTVTFLVRMEDVTEKILVGITEETSEGDRRQIISANALEIENKAIEGTNYTAVIKPFFNGNEYYLFVNEIFNDVRLVGAPPSAIGKFGGDTDNWAWPRHTGDFSVFRIYADKDNKPAPYSEDNIPYKPKKHLPISLKGVNKGDFTMVYGYPGTTNEYLTSFAVKQISEVENPHQIELREKRLDIMRSYMENDAEIRIKYSSKYARVANYWKKWIGENRGLKKLNAIEKKQKEEISFQKWADETEDRKLKYGDLLSRYESLYNKIEPYTLTMDYIYEAMMAIELVKIARSLGNYADFMLSDATEEEKNDEMAAMRKRAESFFKDYHSPIDKKVFAEMIKAYHKNIEKESRPDIYETIEEKFNNDFNAYKEYMFSSSMFVSLEKVNQLIDKGEKGTKTILKDPAYQLFESISNKYNEVGVGLGLLRNQVSKLNRDYMAALRLKNPEKVFYPDANFTLRVTYGKVDDYFPRDGIFYDYYTTLKGIIEKDNPDIYDYNVPIKLKELYKNKDYGRYGEDGVMKVCFTGTNHTTGGNSGSPVLNGNGELIGVNFDRNWEGTMSDIMYDPDQCRNITLDIRYALFVIDKMAGATHLIDEMTLID